MGALCLAGGTPRASPCRTGAVSELKYLSNLQLSESQWPLGVPLEFLHLATPLRDFPGERKGGAFSPAVAVSGP